MLEISEAYLEDEVRDGFYIPSIAKRAWAAELSILHEINRICEKYDIPLKFTQAKLIIDIFEKNQYQIAKTYFNIGFTEQYHRGKFQNQDKIREDLMRDKLKQVFYSKENI